MYWLHATSQPWPHSDARHGQGAESRWISNVGLEFTSLVFLWCSWHHMDKLRKRKGSSSTELGTYFIRRCFKAIARPGLVQRHSNWIPSLVWGNQQLTTGKDDSLQWVPNAAQVVDVHFMLHCLSDESLWTFFNKDPSSSSPLPWRCQSRSSVFWKEVVFQQFKARCFQLVQ